MGIFRKLFGGGQTEQSVRVKQPEGFYIVRYDYGEARARDLFQRADAGEVNAQMIIAKCFKDAAEHAYALPWYEKAAAAGNSQALHELTYFYEGRYVSVEANPEKARLVRSKVLALNNPEAYLKLGSQYDCGDGVKEDKEKAFEYYRKAAELGNNEAMARIGLCYLNGEGVKKNDAKAFQWLLKSNDKYFGYYNLAQCYIKGIGTRKDLEKAVIYLEKAVDGKCIDLSEARRQLVDLYEKGYGGANSKMKQKKIQAEMQHSSDLLDKLFEIQKEEGFWG